MTAPVVLCVLRSGGPDYGPRNVEALAKSLRRHSDAELVCFSDVDVPCRRVPLAHDWPGWWAKIELFRFNYADPVLYVDLDSVFIADPAPLWKERFTMLARVGRPGDVGSGVMSWRGDYSHVYETFSADPARYIREYRSTPKWGDQGFIRDTLGHKAETFSLKHCASYKAHCTDYGKRPFTLPGDDVRLVYFHGKPRPWEVPPIEKGAR